MIILITYDFVCSILNFGSDHEGRRPSDHSNDPISSDNNIINLVKCYIRDMQAATFEDNN
jgi:hypothetical protein